MSIERFQIYSFIFFVHSLLTEMEVIIMIVALIIKVVQTMICCFCIHCHVIAWIAIDMKTAVIFELPIKVISHTDCWLAKYQRIKNCWFVITFLFTKLRWPGDSEGTFRSSSQAATCPPVYHTRRRLHTVLLIAERQAGKLRIPLFTVLGLTRTRIELELTASVAHALSTRPLISICCEAPNSNQTCNQFNQKAAALVWFLTW